MDGVASARLRASLPRDLLHVLLLVTFDVFAIFEAFALSYAIRASDPKPLGHYMTPAHFGEITAESLPVWVTVFALAGLYSVKQRRGKVSELGRVIVVVACGIMLLIVADYLLVGVRHPILPSRSIPVYAMGLGVGFVFVCRLLVRVLLRIAQRRGYGLRNVVLIGAGPAAQRIAATMASPANGYRIVAVVAAEHDGGTTADGVPIFSTLEAALAKVGHVTDEVVQAEVELDRGDIEQMMSLTTVSGMTYRFVPNQYGIYAAASSMTAIAGIPVMDVRLTTLDGWGAVAKRSFDLVGACLLLILLSPVLLTLAVVVKLTDTAGPVFYRHGRIGRGGIPIEIRKFRSMRWQYSTGADRPFKTPAEAFSAMGRNDLVEEFEREHKVQGDPRITPIGRFLRRTSLDELPQLLDVLRGHLSLIGPRPITKDELVRYGGQRANYLALKPGLTGLWQVSGRSDVTYDERVKLDTYYSENWSFGLDLRILARTPNVLISRKGAY